MREIVYNLRYRQLKTKIDFLFCFSNLAIILCVCLIRFEPYLRKACNRFILGLKSGENRPIFTDDSPNKEVNVAFYNFPLLKR